MLGDVVYRSGRSLDAYAPPGEPRPAAVIIHGSQGNKRTQVTQLFEPLARAGSAWFSVDYSTIDDVEEAIHFIRCPGRFNITSEMVLIGEDTGAAIALKVAAPGGLAGVVTFSLRFDSENSLSGPGSQWMPLSSVRSGGERPPRASGLELERPSDPPVLMFHGAKDVEASPAQAAALCRTIPNCVFRLVPGAIHQFENWRPDQWEWKEDLTAWLRRDRRGLWKDIPYARPDGRELLMDACIPEGRGPFAAVIVVHGGGWEAGDKVTYVSPVFEPVARAGMVWFSINYRLTPYVHVPEQLEDVRTAIRYVRSHAERFHVDPDRIALLGESASGHLVVQVASEPCAGCEVRAVASFYGVYDFNGWPQGDEWQRAALKRMFGDWTRETLARYSPLGRATRNLPQMLLIQGTKDELCKGTTEYAARLKEVGARAELVLLEGAPHGMENWEGHSEWTFYKEKLVDWLSSVFGSR